ncbi:N-carbamoylsarcosine amidase [Litorihabitans aurantiacus]|uniref:N-carbamoylsarcosine amidase n=1 Tax=Litorihabitans aurantiacus TaxID=1930061 RepID=A0AA37UV01_9MICO|nr:N-carbamoylsarcosine amidase [Litorihabitans aurantiacus]
MTAEIDWNAEMARVRTARAVRTRVGPGRNPAVVVVDFQVAFTRHAEIGPGTARSLASTAQLLDAARAVGIPVIHLVMVLDDLGDRMLAQRVRSSLTEGCLRGDPRTAIDPAVGAQPGDHVVEKTVASGFFRTRLEGLLAELEVDEIVLAGTSTSGCVRATAVDAAYRSLRVSLVEECCDDFRPLSEQASLWDVQDRFGDVVTLTETLDRFAAGAPGHRAGATA